MNLLYPTFTLRQFGWMLAFGLGGSVIAGTYGILHDQVTYTIGQEYFTRLKFQQFHYLDKTQPLRLVVAEIGFLATWWVGMFAGWFMGRVTLPHLPVERAARLSLTGVGVMTLTAFVFAIVAGVVAPTDPASERLEIWDYTLAEHEVRDAVAFVRVAYIHNASYLGGLIGLIAALVWLFRKVKSHRRDGEVGVRVDD